MTFSKVQRQHVQPISQDGFVTVDSHSTDLDISSAVVLSPPAGATRLLIQALAQNVRYTIDGSTPTASEGFQIKAGDPPGIIYLSYQMIITVIEEAATASLQYQWGY